MPRRRYRPKCRSTGAARFTTESTISMECRFVQGISVRRDLWDINLESPWSALFLPICRLLAGTFTSSPASSSMRLLPTRAWAISMPRLHSDSKACPHTPELFSGSSLLEVRNGRLLCRIALLLFFCYLLSGIPLDFAKPSSRRRVEPLLASMRETHFVVDGFSRTYWRFTCVSGCGWVCFVRFGWKGIQQRGRAMFPLPRSPERALGYSESKVARSPEERHFEQDTRLWHLGPRSISWSTPRIASGRNASFSSSSTRFLNTSSCSAAMGTVFTPIRLRGNITA